MCTKFVHLVVRDKEEQEAWVMQLREQREELLARRAARRQRKRDLAQRRTAAAQERMRLINQLARKDKKEDNFGMRDEDWDVYKTINKVRLWTLLGVKIFFDHFSPFGFEVPLSFKQ